LEKINIFKNCKKTFRSWKTVGKYVEHISKGDQKRKQWQTNQAQTKNGKASGKP